MSTSLLFQELKQYRLSLAVWAGAIASLTVVTMAAMPNMLGASSAMADLVAAFPPEMLRAFNFDAASLSDPLGFYVVYGSLYVALMGGVFAAILGGSIFHKEQAFRTADYLFAQPLSRTGIYLSKLGAVLAILLGFNGLLFAVGAVSLNAFGGEFDLGAYTVVAVYDALLMLSMAGIGVLVSLFADRAKSMTGIVIGIVLALYFIDMAAKVSGSLEPMGWISPFKWMDTQTTRVGFGFESWRLALFALLIVGSFSGAFLIFRKKDILS